MTSNKQPVRYRSAVVLITAALIFLLGAASLVDAQRRDYMTDAEVELVRDNQDIDARVDVLTKMIDRRLAIMNINAGGWKPSPKDADKWGDAPVGKRPELLRDVKFLLQKAVDDIDDVASHDSSSLAQNKTTGKLFPKAVRNLAAAAGRYSSALRPLLDTTKDELETGAIIATLELCEEIAEAAAKLPSAPVK